MKRAIPVVLVLLAAGCGRQCEDADSLTMTGETPPEDTAMVLEVAQEHCDRPIVGTIAWRSSPDTDGAIGRCDNDHACPINAWVTGPGRAQCGPGLNDTAICTVLAHEIGHWCLRTTDEGAASAFGAAVNAEAMERLGAHP